MAGILTESDPPSVSPHCINFATSSSSSNSSNKSDGALDDLLFSLDTHPSRDLIATGTITGNIAMYSYSPGEHCVLLKSVNHHPGLSCRVVNFSEYGSRLFSGSGGKGQLLDTDVETGKLTHMIKKAHSTALYSLYILSEHTLASGDEQGVVKLWDTRTWKQTFHVKENTDFISSMVSDDVGRTLLATSGDGRLSVIDLRKRRLEEKSDCNESELLSVAVMKGGKKVVCGDGEGTLLLYHWGLWGDCTDRYPAHSDSVDSLLALGDSVLCTGSSDGTVRSIQVLPSKDLGVIGHHPPGLPIDNMCLTHDSSFLVTGSQDVCKFWSIESIPTLPGASARQQQSEQSSGASVQDATSDSDGWSKRKKRKRKLKRRQDSAAKGSKQSDSGFFSGLCN